MISSRFVDEGPIELNDADEATVDVADEIPHPDAEISWEDEPVASPRGERSRAADDAPTREARPRSASRPPGTVEPQGGPDGARARPNRRPEARAATIESPGKTRRRRGRNPVWIFALVGLIVVGTVGLRVWRYNRQNYPQIAELGRVEGIPALEAGEFDKAHQLLEPAKRAVDALGGQMEGADEIRQAADEAALFIALDPIGLEVMLDEAAESGPAAWASRFALEHRGRGVVFDTRIKTGPEGSGGRYEIDYIVMPSKETGSFRSGGSRPERSARVDFKGFELFELARPKVGDRVVFGARLAAVEFDTSANSWVVRLEPQSGLFVKFHKALEALGWPEEDASSEETEDAR